MKRMCNLRFPICDWRWAASFVIVGALGAAGCANRRGSALTHAPATQPVTVKNLATTQPSYWLDQPPVTNVSNFQFQPLWDACEHTARSYLFQLDRQDYRLGVLTTKPMVSKQFWELWRGDTGTFHEEIENSLATIRRTVRFEIEHTDDGTYVMTPRVLVERQTIVERRVTSVTQTRLAFTGPGVPTREAITSDVIDLPTTYWTPIGRDTVLEKKLAEKVRERLKK
jgi:hypothetical protein